MKKDNVRKTYLHSIQKSWKSFVEEKRNEKDIRFLFLKTPHFFDTISSFKIIRAVWTGNPHRTENPGYIIRLRYSKIGEQLITGVWGEFLVVERPYGTKSSENIFSEEELEILRSFFEEFEMDKVISNLDETIYSR